MPNITEYRSPPLDLNPAERGVSAWDAAARRIGAFYGEVAGTQRAQGSLAAQALKQKLWPFDILALYEAQARGAAGGGGGGGVRVRGAHNTFGGPTENFAGFGESRNTGAPAGVSDFAQVLAGAGALARGLADGGYQAARMRRSGGGGGDGGSSTEGDGADYTLLGGGVYSPGFYREVARRDAQDRDLVNQEMDRYRNEANDVANYWRQWNGDTGTVQQYPGSAEGPVVSSGGAQPSEAATSPSGDYSGSRDAGSGWWPF